jgi:hypothetical protein
MSGTVALPLRSGLWREGERIKHTKRAQSKTWRLPSGPSGREASWTAVVLCRFSPAGAEDVARCFIRRPLPKRQRTGAVQNLADFPPINDGALAAEYIFQTYFSLFSAGRSGCQGIVT